MMLRDLIDGLRLLTRGIGSGGGVKTKIVITEAHVKKMKAGNWFYDCERCAIALAINEVLAPKFNVEVWRTHYSIVDWSPRVTRKLPPQVVKAIGVLDGDGTIALPLAFYTNIPSKYLRTTT